MHSSTEASDRPTSRKRRALLAVAGWWVATALWAIPSVAPPGSVVVASSPTALGAYGDLPDRIDDGEFWRLMTALEEQPSGSYSSDNLVSNEILFADVLPTLRETIKPGNVFLGVGPEQNFSFIADLKPGIAFVVDLRRVNWHLHLMYKAVFGLSSDRIQFLSQLFAKARPEGLKATATAADLLDAFAAIPTTETTIEKNVQLIADFLTRERRLPLSRDDLDGIVRVYRAFCSYGLSLDSASTLKFAKDVIGRSGPNFVDLMTQGNAVSGELSYLASEQRFLVVKELQARNLVVPVVGNFAGPKTLRGIGAYLRDRQVVLDAFYLSNVENYLRRDGLWDAFCRNVASMPLRPSSLFVRVTTTSFVYYANGIRRNIPPAGTEVVPIARWLEPCR